MQYPPLARYNRINNSKLKQRSTTDAYYSYLSQSCHPYSFTCSSKEAATESYRSASAQGKAETIVLRTLLGITENLATGLRLFQLAWGLRGFVAWRKQVGCFSGHASRG